ncbi:LAGLIDADG family homing endonuclease, partial [Candidatus Uhrbacteria bacterium]|nr:LAGLIDADG family homing endonuclease [Candidatus Uhrbacteria bacterium]
MAYILGFIIADGAVYSNPRGSQYVAFYSCDKELLPKIREALGSNHKIRLSEPKNKKHKFR